MATKKKTESKDLYINGKKATLKMVYEQLKNEIEKGCKTQIIINTSLLNKLNELEKKSKEHSSYNIHVVVPEPKPWYKRLFGKSLKGATAPCIGRVYYDKT